VSQLSARIEFAAKLGRAEQSAKGGLEKLEIVLFTSASRQGGRKGGSVFALPPAEPIARNFGSDIFEHTPPVITFYTGTIYES